MKTLAPELSALMTILRSTGSGDLDLAIEEIAGRRSDLPVRVPDRARLGEKLELGAHVDCGLALLPGTQ